MSARDSAEDDEAVLAAARDKTEAGRLCALLLLEGRDPCSLPEGGRDATSEDGRDGARKGAPEGGRE